MKIRLMRDPMTNTLRILLVKTANGKQLVAEPVTLKFREAKEAEDVPPTLILDNPMDETAISLIGATEAMSGRTSKESLLQGMLQAKDQHLNDLRVMLQVMSGGAITVSAPPQQPGPKNPVDSPPAS